MTKELNKEYSDISLNFTPHPITGDMSRLTGLMSIKTAVRNLIMTNFGERHYDVNKGSDLTALLFQNYSPLLEGVIQRKVEYVLSNYEPRVQLLDVRVDTTSIDNNAIAIEIRYRIVTSGDIDNVRIEIERAR